MTDIEVVLKAGTAAFVEGEEVNLVPRRLDGDAGAKVFAMNDDWHIYDVNGVLHYVPAAEDR